MIILFRILFLIGLLGCSLSANSLASILVLGDSLSSGYGIDPNQGWVALLEKRLEEDKKPYQIINISNSGDTTTNGIEKFPAALKHYQPEIVIIALGSNDGLRGLPAASIQENLSLLVKLAEENHAKVLLVGFLIPLNYGPIYRQQFENVFQKVAKQFHLLEVPFLLEGVALNPKLMQEDGLHPNAAGQPIILENVWPYLKQLL